MRASAWLAPTWSRVPRTTNSRYFSSLRVLSNVFQRSGPQGRLIPLGRPRVNHFRPYYCFTSGEDPFETRVISSDSNQSTREKPADYRLPTNVKPKHYDLTFKTDLEGLKFWGYAIIE